MTREEFAALGDLTERRVKVTQSHIINDCVSDGWIDTGVVFEHAPEALWIDAEDSDGGVFEICVGFGTIASLEVL